MLETLLLPGLMCNEAIWDDQVRALGSIGARAAHGYRLCRRMEDMAQTVLDSAPERFNLCGHSMGARVALEVLRKAPERVTKLALLDTGIHPVGPGEKDKRYALWEIGKTEGVAALVDRWLPPMVAEANHANTAMMQRLHAMACSAGLDGFEAQIHALLDRPEVESFLPTISIPTLIGVGELDVWSPPVQHEHIAQLIPGSRLVQFAGAGHMAPAETPDAVTGALQDWIVN